MFGNYTKKRREVVYKKKNRHNVEQLALSFVGLLRGLLGMLVLIAISWVFSSSFSPND